MACRAKTKLAITLENFNRQQIGRGLDSYMGVFLLEIVTRLHVTKRDPEKERTVHKLFERDPYGVAT